MKRASRPLPQASGRGHSAAAWQHLNGDEARVAPPLPLAGEGWGEGMPPTRGLFSTSAYLAPPRGPSSSSHRHSKLSAFSLSPPTWRMEKDTIWLQALGPGRLFVEGTKIIRQTTHGVSGGELSSMISHHAYQPIGDLLERIHSPYRPTFDTMVSMCCTPAKAADRRYAYQPNRGFVGKDSFAISATFEQPIGVSMRPAPLTITVDVEVVPAL
jgi:hypothetical protein